MPYRTLVVATLLSIAYFADATPAHAYIDPGMGSMLLQGIVGGAATFLVIICLYGAKAKRVILGALGRSPAKSDQGEHYTN